MIVFKLYVSAYSETVSMRTRVLPRMNDYIGRDSLANHKIITCISKHFLLGHFGHTLQISGMCVVLKHSNVAPIYFNW